MHKVSDYSVCKVQATFMVARTAENIARDLAEGYSDVFGGACVQAATVTETRRIVFSAREPHDKQTMLDSHLDRL